MHGSYAVLSLTFVLLTATLPAAYSQEWEGPPGNLWIVTFEEAPLATYAGGVPGLEATNPAVRVERKLNSRAQASIDYLAFLDQRHEQHIDLMERTLKRSMDVKFRYRAAGNGIAVRLDLQEAALVARLPGVVTVVPDRHVPVDTDSSPQWIGAPDIWNAKRSLSVGYKGEGIIVGIIDTGINMGHPSFADIGGDGYDHTNPLGTGNYLGWCDPSNPDYDPTLVCNDKLIGAWDFADGNNGEDDGPEDDNGHGSHTSSTAAGNTLLSPAISGVAPHANIIIYDACYTNTAGQGACPFSATTASADQALLDGVDAINYSISGGTSPWGGDIDTYFLNLFNAGVFVACSAGNSGPTPGTVAHLGPWVSSVASTTHDHEDVQNTVTLSGGGSALGPFTGSSRTTQAWGPTSVVYAGNYSNGDPNPEQCLNPFPAGTWTSGETVVCDRGTIARVMKCQNVFVGGAGGCVLTNVSGGAQTVVPDAHILPASHFAQTDGDSLKTWLGSGSGHQASISASQVIRNPALADIISGFSSRGPNPSFDVLKPEVAAPGDAIFAAYHDDNIAGFNGDDFATIGGTSMASPHVAGAGALLTQMKPTWSPAEIKSALMTTSNLNVLDTDGVTPADPFDTGSGRIDLSKAGQAGLVLDETHANFLAANPATGGEPRDLNLASMMNSTCNQRCSWGRTVTSAAALGGPATTWTAVGNGPSGVEVTLTPSVFSLDPGESRYVRVDAWLGAGVTLNTWAHAELVLTPDDVSLETTHFPISVYATGTGVLPALFADGFESGDTSLWSSATTP